VTPLLRRGLALIVMLSLAPIAFARAADNPPPAGVALATATPLIVEPATGSVLDKPSTDIIVRSAPGDKVQLMVNGVAVKDNQIGVLGRADDGSLVETWIGVPLDADGRTIVSITGQLMDENNLLAARDGMVRLAATAGDFVGDSAQPEMPGFYVQAHDGQFNAVLRAGLHSGTAHITATVANLEANLDIEMTTELRPSIATGVVDLRFGARQSDFYKSISTFLAGDPSFKPELQTSVFATGKVGNYLLTVAGDNQYPINPPCNGTIGVTTYEQQAYCTPQYPIYGDESTSTRLAQSSDNVYFRLERDRTYEMC